MDFGQVEGRPGLYEANFNSEEVFAINAAYKERLAKLVLAEELDSVTDIDLEMGTLAMEDDGVRLNGQGLRDIATALCDFASATPVEVEALIRRTGVPNYRNESIVERIRLGRIATTLARDMQAEIEVIAFNGNFTFDVAEKTSAPERRGEVLLLPPPSESLS